MRCKSFVCLFASTLFQLSRDGSSIKQGLMCGSRVISIFTNCPQPAEIMLSKPSSIRKGRFACQWLGNVDMHVYVKCDQTIPYGLRVMSISTNC